MKKSFLVGLFLLISVGISAQNPFEKEIEAYEAKDKINMPHPGMRLFIGSSSFRIWKDMYEDLIGYEVINRGFGGSQLSDVLYFYDRMVKKYQPSWIFLYEGDNDINAGKSPQQVYDEFMQLVSWVKRDMPKTKIVFVAIKPSISRFKLIDVQRNLHELILQEVIKDKNLFFIDTHNPFFNSNAELMQDVFLKDGLHLNKKGYSIFGGAILDFLKSH